MVADAIRHLSGDGVDIIVVIRGGGARNDLAAFDTEPIARAIAGASVPVFTGIGHEIDRSVADEVAHSAWKTPTACAGAIVDLVAEFVARTEEAWTGIHRAAVVTLDTASIRLMTTAQRIARQTHVAVSRSDERLAGRAHRVVTTRRRLEEEEAGITRSVARLAGVSRKAVERAERRLDDLDRRRGLLDPARLLERGWSITTDGDGRVVRSIAAVAGGSELRTRLADGVAVSTVSEVMSDD